MVPITESTTWSAELLSKSFDAVVLNVAQGEAEGWQALRLLKANPTTRDIPVLFYAATDRSGAVLELNYLTKPLELAESRALWMAATQINREIKELTPVLLAPTVGPEVKYALKTEGDAVSHSPLRCILKPHPAGGYVLLTVNMDDAVLKVTYDFPGGLTAVEPLFENRPPYELKPAQTTFEDMYDPFETHVYRLRP